ncbi:MAG: twin transmembrane helix small protein [Azospirillaceae bacterium]|nr:twin transmembrane helix small protein [Azospirillaceae bacterium]
MSRIFALLMIIAMAGVVGVLLMGLLAMARGGSFNARHGNRLMRWRVVLQGLALLFLALAFFTAR